MIARHIVAEIERLQNHIKAKKERIEKLRRLDKLHKNIDLISEYDLIIKRSDDTINAILESQDVMDAHKEQVILHSCAKTRLMAQGLKNNLCDSEKQIGYLNDGIESDNQRIKQLEKETKTTGGIT